MPRFLDHPTYHPPTWICCFGQHLHRRSGAERIADRAGGLGDQWCFAHGWDHRTRFGSGSFFMFPVSKEVNLASRYLANGLNSTVALFLRIVPRSAGRFRLPANGGPLHRTWRLVDLATSKALGRSSSEALLEATWMSCEGVLCLRS